MPQANFRFKNGNITAQAPLGRASMPPPAMFEDFLGVGATLADNPNVLISQAGTPTTAAAVTATAGAPNAGAGGWLAGSVDNVDAEIDEIALGKLPWLTPGQAGISTIFGEVGFVVPSALTARQYFFGLTDDETEGTGTNGSLNIQTGTTLTSVADNAAGFIMSSLATDADGYYTASSNATSDSSVLNTGLTAIVDRYTVLRVEVDVLGNALFFGRVGAAADTRYTVQNRCDVVDSNALAVATTSLLLPLFAAAATTTTAVEWEIDYLAGGVTVA